MTCSSSTIGAREASGRDPSWATALPTLSLPSVTRGPITSSSTPRWLAWDLTSIKNNHPSPRRRSKMKTRCRVRKSLPPVSSSNRSCQSLPRQSMTTASLPRVNMKRGLTREALRLSPPKKIRPYSTLPPPKRMRMRSKPSQCKKSISL